MSAPPPSFDEVDKVALRRRGTSKWSRYDADVLPLWVAEMDFATAPVVLAAIRDAVERQEFGYPLVDASTGVPEATAGWFERRYGVHVDPDRVRLLPDVMKGVELALEAFSPPDAPIVLPIPAYMPFFEVAAVVRRPLIEVPMRRSGGRFELDLDRIDTAFRHGARTMILCNPYNPLGRNFSRSELSALADLVEHHGARIVSDEIHGPLTYGTRYVPYASVSPVSAGHSVTLVSATKAWNLPGLKCAQALLTNEADVRVWSRLSNLSTHGASTIGITATVAAYEGGAEWLDAALDYLDENRRMLGTLLQEQLPLVQFTSPEATYLAWLDLNSYGLGEEPADRFLRDARVALNPGLAFGSNGAGCVRLNFATSKAILHEAFERIVTAMPAR